MNPWMILQTRHLHWLLQLRRFEELRADGETHLGELPIEIFIERARAALSEIELLASQVGVELRDPYAFDSRKCENGHSEA